MICEWVTGAEVWLEFIKSFESINGQLKKLVTKLALFAGAVLRVNSRASPLFIYSSNVSSLAVLYINFSTCASVRNLFVDRASGIIDQENEKSLRYRREEIGFNRAARPTTAGDIYGWLGHVGCAEEAVWEQDLGQGGWYLH